MVEQDPIQIEEQQHKLQDYWDLENHAQDTSDHGELEVDHEATKIHQKEPDIDI